MYKNEYKRILTAFLITIAVGALLLSLYANRIIFICAVILVFVVLSLVRMKKTDTSKTELFERLGISNKEELSHLLCKFEELVPNKLYVKDELVVNINTYKSYYLYEIEHLEKLHHNGKRTVYDDVYELVIYTSNVRDVLDFETSVNARDCAYLLINRKMQESRADAASDISEKIVSNEAAYDTSEYDDMIMDDEDIKGRNERSDWLGSV